MTTILPSFSDATVTAILDVLAEFDNTTPLALLIEVAEKKPDAGYTAILSAIEALRSAGVITTTKIGTGPINAYHMREKEAWSAHRKLKEAGVLKISGWLLKPDEIEDIQLESKDGRMMIHANITSPHYIGFASSRKEKPITVYSTEQGYTELLELFNQRVKNETLIDTPKDY